MNGAGSHPMQSGFAADEDGARWVATGALTFPNASAVFAATIAVPLPASAEIALDQVAAVDSSAVALLLALKRRAAGEGRTVTFTHVPAALTALAELYGVKEMLVA